MKKIRPVIGLILLAAPVAAQHEHAAPREMPVALLPGMGSHHFAITTSSAEAQKFFDQGLTLMYGFNFPEAARSFRKAAELDPQAAMPHWGMALAIGPNYNDTPVTEERARNTHDAITTARKLATSATERERAYIEALARRYSPEPAADRAALQHAYSAAMRDVMRKFPDDMDAATLYAESLMMQRPWQLWTPDGAPAPGTEEIVATLESVLRREPNHVGANHLYIHAVEASRTPERALANSERLKNLVTGPGAGHLVHMPGHIYLQLGEYEESAKTNEKAAEGDREFIARTNAAGEYTLMYYSHNLHFIAVSRMEQGRYTESIREAERLVTNVRAAIPEMQMLEGWMPMPYFVQLRFQKWDEVLKHPEPPAVMKMTRALRRYARALAFIAKGDLERATAERKEFEAARRDVPEEHIFTPNNPAAPALKLPLHIIDARMAQARHDWNTAVAHWREAVMAQDALSYEEPPPWYFPAREALGVALLRAGKLGEAEEVLRENLRRNPRNGRALFALWQCLAAQKRPTEAALVEAQFRAAWKSAEVELRLEDL